MQRTDVPVIITRICQRSLIAVRITLFIFFPSRIPRIDSILFFFTLSSLDCTSFLSLSLKLLLSLPTFPSFLWPSFDLIELRQKKRFPLLASCVRFFYSIRISAGGKMPKARILFFQRGGSPTVF